MYPESANSQTIQMSPRIMTLYHTVSIVTQILGSQSLPRCRISINTLLVLKLLPAYIKLQVVVKPANFTPPPLINNLAPILSHTGLLLHNICLSDVICIALWIFFTTPYEVVCSSLQMESLKVREKTICSGF